MIARDENFQRGAHRLSRGDFLGALFAGGIVLGGCLLLLWRDPLLFWNDDYQISILPVFADIARSWSQGHWPLLSPYSWICGNLAGEFQYGTFSLFINPLVVLIWKFPLAFAQQAAALSIAHLLVLAAGAFLLARDRNLSSPLSTMVAIVAALNGWIMCWGATDWFGALGAFAWLPWSWWAMERALDPRRGRWRFLWPAPFVYLLITGGFPYTVLMLGLLGAWLALRSLGQTRKISSVIPMAFGFLLGCGLSAPAWLALFDSIQGSARESQPASAHFQWLLPWRALPGFILPNWTTNWSDFSTRLAPHAATELACGLAAPAALLGGLLLGGRSFVRQIKWELGLLAAVLLIAMLPSAGVFRWSFRWLPFLHLILAVCAAEALRQLDVKRAVAGSPRIFFSAGFWALALTIVTASAMLLARTVGNYGFTLASIFCALGFAWLLVDSLPARFRIFQIWMPASITFAAFLATYFCLPTNCGVPKYPFTRQLLSPTPLDPQRLYLSVYPPPETAYRVANHPDPVGQVVRPGSAPMWAALHFINGYSPIRTAGVAREFASYIHGEIDLGTAEYLLGWRAGHDDELAALGIDGIIVARDIAFAPKPDDEWSLVFSSAEGRVYHRRGGTIARVRSIPYLESLPNERFATAGVAVVEDSRNRVVANIATQNSALPSLVVFSRPYFSGYQARLGTEKLPVDSYRGLVPVVKIPAGKSGRLSLTYRPAWLVAGEIAAALSVLVIVASFFGAVRSRSRDQ